MTVRVGENCLDLTLRYLKLLGYFSNADPVIEVIDNRTHGQTSSAQYRSATLHLRIHLN